MTDVFVFLNNILLSTEEWEIVNNDLQLKTFVKAGDKIKLRCGEAFLGYEADGTTNRWHLNVEIDKLRFNNFMYSVYDHKDEPIVANLLDQLRTAIGLID